LVPINTLPIVKPLMLDLILFLLTIKKPKTMKRLLSICAFMACSLVFNHNAQAQQSAIKVTRTEQFLTPTPGAAPVNLTLTFKKLTGLFTVNESKTFTYNNTTIQNYTATFPATSSIKFSVTMDSQTSTGTYFLPTTLNASVTIPADDCGMKHIAGQYGYGVTVKCVGTDQYIVTPVRYECLNCQPCGGGVQ
jgi:hypothetical protein